MKKMKWLVWLVEVMITVVGVVLIIHWQAFSNKVIPRVMVSGINVSGIREDNLEQVLQKSFTENPNEITLNYNGVELIKATNLEISYDFAWTASLAMNVGRSGNLLTQAKERILFFFKPLEIEPAINYNEDELKGLVALASEEVKQEYSPAKIIINDQGVPEFMAGVDGVWIKEMILTDLLIEAMKKPGKQVINVPIEKNVANFDDERVAAALELSTRWLDKEMVFEYEDFEMNLSTAEVVSLLGIADSFINEVAFEELYLLLEGEVNRNPQNAIFKFEDGGVLEFQADLKGIELERDELADLLERMLVNLEEKVVLPVKMIEPEIKASEINDLGIKDLLGRGKSEFSHSIPSRIFNVALASRRINYALIPPGEIFSFNEEVGEISSLTGYRSAYVIKDGRTVLGDGGGTCQVSTTMFRAAMKAGLPIVQRKAHSYRVGYYEQDSGPGVDATVYAPTADLKFLNDTPEHILIQVKVDTKNLTMNIDIFGTSDGRTSTVSEPKVWGQSAPPEPLYEDDPTLPIGVIKQIDWAASGAKTSFDYKVKREGEVIYEKTFYSNFRPWQAVYLRGVKE